MRSQYSLPNDLPRLTVRHGIRIAQIIGSISREVYTLRNISQDERVKAATKLIQRVHEWHASLPVHLGSIRPFMLIPRYRRQATVLKLAYSHAIMHANRLFLLGNSSTTYESQVNECMEAAKSVLETVDRLAKEGPIFHAFWWTHYVTFCALVVTYVWEIQLRRTRRVIGKQNRAKLMELAERCETHLANATASNSPSRRYAVILEEFRAAATNTSGRSTAAPATENEQSRASQIPGQPNIIEAPMPSIAEGVISNELGQVLEVDPALSYDTNILDEWNTTDWLDLDSSVGSWTAFMKSLLTFRRHFGRTWTWTRRCFGQTWLESKEPDSFPNARLLYL